MSWCALRIDVRRHGLHVAWTPWPRPPDPLLAAQDAERIRRRGIGCEFWCWSGVRGTMATRVFTWREL